MQLQTYALKPLSKSNFSSRFEHPMFKYEVDPIADSLLKSLREARKILVIGLGGSVLPLKALVDAAGLYDQILFLDSVDPNLVESAFLNLDLTKDLIAIASKSGETLEIKMLLQEALTRGWKSRLLVVTDPVNGALRKFATEQNLPTLPIPPELGGRFTHFTPFHRALFESRGISFNDLLTKAKKIRDRLSASSELVSLLQSCFSTQQSVLGLWVYERNLFGLAEWIQQAIAESLGKKSKDGSRHGILPVVLKGPQDQHSVLQLLMDGPQDKSFWFLMPPNGKSLLARSLSILAESTAQTFIERTENKETQQSVVLFKQEESTLEFAIEMIVTTQALCEMAGDLLNITPFDQPGVERGKIIARELIKNDDLLSKM